MQQQRPCEEEEGGRKRKRERDSEIDRQIDGESETVFGIAAESFQREE